MQRALFFDIETRSVDELWRYSPEDYFRLGGYAWGTTGEVHLTDDLEEMRRVIRDADIVVGHNIHNFDLTAIFGKDSTEPLQMALDDRVFDTWTFSTLVHPAPSKFVDRSGTVRFIRGPEDAKRWHRLDEQAHQLGVPGKLHDLKALAAEFGGFHRIPLDDERFRAYLVQDVEATRDVTRRLCHLGDPNDPYAIREQINAAIDAQNTRNGWRVDAQRAKDRIAEQEETNRRYMSYLVERFDMPTSGKAPLRTNAGKAAVFRALAEVGISEDELPRTKSGAPSLGGEGLVEVAADKSDEARELANAIATIGGLRPLAQSALDNTQPDGRVHPDIHTLQRSGRKSTQDPGLTVWTSRGSGSVEKSYFVPNSDDELLVEFDYSQADARIVAALSGDEAYLERFAPGADAHLITANAVWPDAGWDRSNPETEAYRQQAKALGHAYAYRAGARTLANSAKQPIEVAQKFVAAMQRQYRAVTRWQDRVTQYAQRHGFVVNAWGRRMTVTEGREFTQAPALHGQSGTREIVVDGLIRMARRDIRLITFLVAQVHDALVFSIPKNEIDYWIPNIKECMETTWGPEDGRGQRVQFPVESGTPSPDWQSAGH